RMRELEQEQRGLRDDLTNLLEDIKNHANRLPDTPELAQLKATALKFADAVHNSGAAEAMLGAEAGLIDFSGTTAYERALEAAEILEKFISQCQGMGGECK